MAPVDRLLRADRPSQTVLPAVCPHQRTPIAPSWPPRIIAVTSEIRTGQRQELFFEVPIIDLALKFLAFFDSAFNFGAEFRANFARRGQRLRQLVIVGNPA